MKLRNILCLAQGHIKTQCNLAFTRRHSRPVPMSHNNGFFEMNFEWLSGCETSEDVLC